MAAEAKITKLCNQRTVLIEQLNRTEKFIVDKLQQSSLPEIELRLSSLDDCFKQLNIVQSSLEGLDENEVKGTERGLYEERYFEMKPKLIIEINNKKVDSQDSKQEILDSNLTRVVRLPKIEIKTFGGDYTKWMEFYESFKVLVDKNTTLNNVSRFQYLRNSLEGTAARTIESLELTADNYSAALELLTERYNNKRLISLEHIRSLFNARVIDRASSEKLRVLIDTFNSNLRALSSLGRPTHHWDDLIVYILYTKLDSDTRSKWDDEVPSDRLPTLEELLAFLKRRCHSLENQAQSLSSTIKPPRTAPIYNIKHSSGPRKTQHSLVMFNNYKCNYCNKLKHSIFRCTSFLTLSSDERLHEVNKRNLCVNCLHSDHLVDSCTITEHCKKCTEKHHTLLHQLVFTSANNNGPTSSTSITSILETVLNEPSNREVLTSSMVSTPYVFLATTVVRILDNHGNPIHCRALLDSASQLSFMTESLAIQLGIEQHKTNLSIRGIGCSKVTSHSKIKIILQSCFNGFSTSVEPYILPEITSYQPCRYINGKSWPIPKNINLADPQFNSPNKIDLLIGADIYFSLLSVGQIKLSNNLPILQNTVLGWVISDTAHAVDSTTPVVCNIAHSTENLNSQIEKFWLLEDIDPINSTANQLNPEEIASEAHFTNNTKRDINGRYTVRLPFHKDPLVLGNSWDIALRRFYNLERKLSKDMELKNQYTKFLDDYERHGHMKEITNINSIASNYFMPHHCISKPESSTTKLRVVFDASAKTDSGISLNDLMMVGPVVQNDLFTVLIRFRSHKFAFSADISKMYRQIRVDEVDTKYQCIIWRKDMANDLKVFKLTTVTYGTSSAPFLATRCIKQLVIDDGHQYTLATIALTNDIYVDDILSGANTLEESLNKQSEIINMLKGAQMDLKKWCANDERLLTNISESDREILHCIDDCDFIKTLGLFWEPIKDKFKFQVKLQDHSLRTTKRTVISDLARIFDPLGLVAPTVLLGKIFMQELWKLKIHWDAALPQEMAHSWEKYRRDMLALNALFIDRHVFSKNIPIDIQLHAFSDASERAYGAVIYVRSVFSDNTIVVNLLCAKSRVAPLKQTSLPRLELTAANLLVKLVRRVFPTLNFKVNRTFYYTDSTIVLNWLNNHSSNWKTFVANRVSNIQQYTSIDNWNHVDSKNNPADTISRGVQPNKLLQCKLWFQGPDFLALPELSWPSAKISNSSSDSVKLTDMPEKRKMRSVLTAFEIDDDILEGIKFKNNYISVRNIVSYMCRYIHNIKCSKDNAGLRNVGPLSIKELEIGLTAIIRLTQLREFYAEILALKSNKLIPKKSRLKSLAVFLDNDGLLRVGGRLKHSSLSYDSKHPIVLPSNHYFSIILLKHFHLRSLHAGPQALLAAVRQQYWPMDGRRLCRKVFQDCIRCFKTSPTTIQQLMGDLPAERINYSSPFTNVGVDLCGPFYIHYKLRGKTPSKAFLAIFVCFAVKAVHCELVSDLSTDAFIGALKRFIATRGICSNIFPDNATNFVGANSQLHELNKLFNTEDHKTAITKFCQNECIQWRFAPPRSPNFGGLYEAAVKSAKFHLRRIMGNASLTFEELNTLVKQVEAVLNSRPLTPLSQDPDDLEVITPGHFLIGRPLTTIPERTIDSNISSLRRWQLQSQLHQHFWSRWSKEYLNLLQSRSKWREKNTNININRLVLLKEDLPPLKWKLGRVIELHPGPDGLIRVVTVKHATGTVKRSISNICPLPEFENSSTSSGNLLKAVN